MKIRDFSGGLNTYDDRINLSDNQCASLENVCFESGPVLRSRYGFTRGRAVSNVRGIYNWYKGNTRHEIYSTTSGLYDNGVRLTASIDGAFHAVEYGEMLYLVDGTYMKRYDGTTLYNWGVDAPDAPTVTASVRSSAVIDNFEASPLLTASQYSGPLGTWVVSKYVDGGTFGKMASCFQASQVYSGNKAMRLTISEDDKILVRKHMRDRRGAAATHTDLSTGTNREDITLYLKTAHPEYIKHISMTFMARNGYFAGPKFRPGEMYESRKLRDIGTEDEHLSEAGMELMYMPQVADEWVQVRIPKDDFESYRGASWDMIRSLNMYINTNTDTGGASLVIYMDDMAHPQDVGLYGRYYFVANYYSSERNEHFAVSEESGGQLLDLEGVVVSSVPATYDAQVDQYRVWARREDWTNWYLLGSVAEATTSKTFGADPDTFIYNEELTSTTGMYPANVVIGGIPFTRLGSNNLPPPVSTNICMHRNKMFFAKSDGKIYHSKPGEPYAVPAGHYIIATSDADPVTGFYSDGMDLTAFSRTKEYSYLQAGEYDQMNIYAGMFIDARDFKRGCVSPHSIADGLLASSQGICFWDGQRSKLLSRIIQRTYRAIQDKTALHATVWEDMYLLVNPNGSSIVCEKTPDGGIRFYLWSFTSTARCCAVDRFTNRLYVGTDTGIYYYDTSSNRDTEGAFTMLARLKEFEYAPEDKDAALERFTLHSNTGGNGIVVSVLVDGVVHGTNSANTSARTESEFFTDLGSIGSYVQPRIRGSVGAGSPILVYGLEISGGDQ